MTVIGKWIRLLMVAGVLSACTEQVTAPVDNNQRLTTGARIANVAGAWGVPVEIASEVFQTPQAEIVEADMVTLAQGDSFVTWETDQFSPTWVIKSTIMHRAPGSAVWQEDIPFDPNKSVGAPRLYTNAGTDFLYAMWHEINPDVVTTANDTFISRYTQGSGWGASIKIGKLSEPFNGYDGNLFFEYQLGRFIIRV